MPIGETLFFGVLILIGVAMLPLGVRLWALWLGEMREALIEAWNAIRGH